MNVNRIKSLICIFLVITTFCVYSQVQYHEFINYDDNFYVTKNQFVQSDLSNESIIRIFTNTDAHIALYVPITTLSTPMSNNSLASSTINDWLGRKLSLGKSMLISGFWACLLILISLVFDEGDSAIIVLGFKIASFTYGGLLSLFILSKSKEVCLLNSLNDKDEFLKKFSKFDQNELCLFFKLILYFLAILKPRAVNSFNVSLSSLSV